MAGQINPMALLDPQSVADQNQIEYQRQMAQALMGNAMQPAQGQMVGPVYVGASPIQGLAKLLAAYGGKQMMDKANAQSVALSQRQGQMIRSMFNPEQPSAVDQAGQMTGNLAPTPENAALIDALKKAQAANAKKNPMVIGNMDANTAMMSMLGNPEKYWEKLMENYQSTPDMKNAEYSGLGPDAVKADLIKKGMITAEPGKPFVSAATGQSGFVPSIPQNAQPNQPYNFMVGGGRMGPVTAVPGTQAVTQANAGSQALGTTGGTLHNVPVQNPDGTVTENVPTLGSRIIGQPGPAINDDARIPTLKAERAKAIAEGRTADAQSIDRELKGLGVKFGMPQGAAENKRANIDAGAKILTDTQANASTANNAISSLQQIYHLAATNPGAFGNGAQGFANFKAYLARAVPGLDQAKTAQDIVAKLNANMAGGSRTDAELETKILSLPGTEKTADAVKEIVPLLVGQYRQHLAKAAVLTSARDQANGDNSVVSSKAQQFDALSDPRIINAGYELARVSNLPGANQKGTAANKELTDLVTRIKNSSVPNAWDRLMKLNQMGAF